MHGMYCGHGGSPLFYCSVCVRACVLQSHHADPEAIKCQITMYSVRGWKKLEPKIPISACYNLSRNHVLLYTAHARLFVCFRECVPKDKCVLLLFYAGCDSATVIATSTTPHLAAFSGQVTVDGQIIRSSDYDVLVRNPPWSMLQRYFCI